MGALKLVGKVGFEPTHPKEPDLQSGATLQLRRLPIFTLNSGAGNRNRTRDLLLTRQLLYLLSYTGKLEARIGIEPILTGLWDQCHPRRHSRIKLLSNLFNKGYHIILGGYGIHRSLYWHDLTSWFHPPVCLPYWSPIPLRRDSFHIKRFSIFVHQCSLVRFDGIIITQREQLVNNFFHIWWKYFLIRSIWCIRKVTILPLQLFRPARNPSQLQMQNWSGCPKSNRDLIVGNDTC